MRIRLLVADDDVNIADGMGCVLDMQPDFSVVAVAYNGQSAVDAALKHRPDLVLMDLRMPVLDGVAATRMLHAQLPAVKVVALTNMESDEYVFDALRAGADGYLLKTEPVKTIIRALNDVMVGGAALSAAIARQVIDDFREREDRRQSASALYSLLTPREITVLHLIAERKTNNQIARELERDVVTVKRHVGSILAKLHVNNRLEAASLARHHGL